MAEHQHRGDAAWVLLLKHLWSMELPCQDMLQVCSKLLCVSQQMSDLVHVTCRGRLQAAVGQQPATQHGFSLGAWLAKHAVLLESLELHLSGAEQEAAVAAGLVTAAQQCTPVSAQPLTPQAAAPAAPAATTAAQHTAGRASLPLTSFRCQSPSNGRLLCGLSGLGLTQLTLHLQLQDDAGASQQQFAALASLQQLRSLTLAGAWCDRCFMPVLGPALKHMTQLTQLRLPRVLLNASSIQMLPNSLQHLSVCCHNQPLQLQRLTALRSLHLEQQLHAGESLPSSLTALWLGRCESVQPLLLLHDLQWLRVDYDLTPEQLHDLTGLPQLQSVQLSYFCCTQGKQCDHGTLACAAGQLSQVPLKQLRVLGQWGCGHLPAAVVQQLGVLTQLTSLSLQDLVLEVTPQQLAARLQQLTALQQLELRCLQYVQPAGEHVSVQSQLHSQEGPRGGDIDDWVAFAGVLSSMMGLRELSWLGMPSCAAAAVTARLQAATQLTKLDVGDPAAADVAVVFKACCGVRN